MTKKGRPSIYSDELAEQICERIANGMSMREITRADDMPGMSTVFRWLADNLNFREQYARAKEAQAEYLAEELLEISDDGSNDWMERKNAEGELVGWNVNGEAIQRSKLRVDARKWLMSKMLPKKYGDKIDINHSGAMINMDKSFTDAEEASRAYKDIIKSL